MEATACLQSDLKHPGQPLGPRTRRDTHLLSVTRTCLFLGRLEPTNSRGPRFRDEPQGHRGGQRRALAVGAGGTAPLCTEVARDGPNSPASGGRGCHRRGLEVGAPLQPPWAPSCVGPALGWGKDRVPCHSPGPARGARKHEGRGETAVRTGEPGAVPRGARAGRWGSGHQAVSVSGALELRE